MDPNNHQHINKYCRDSILPISAKLSRMNLRSRDLSPKRWTKDSFPIFYFSSASGCWLIYMVETVAFAFAIWQQIVCSNHHWCWERERFLAMHEKSTWRNEVMVGWKKKCCFHNFLLIFLVFIFLALSTLQGDIGPKFLLFVLRH